MTPQRRHRLGLTARGIAEHDETFVPRQIQGPVGGEGGGLAERQRGEERLAVVVRELRDDDEDRVPAHERQLGRERAVGGPDHGARFGEEIARALPAHRPQGLRGMVRDQAAADLGAFGQGVKRPADAAAARDGDRAVAHGLAQGVQAQGARARRQRALGQKPAERLERPCGDAALAARGGPAERPRGISPDRGPEGVDGRHRLRAPFWQVEGGQQRRLRGKDLLNVVAGDDLDAAERLGRAVAGQQGRVDADPSLQSFHDYQSWRPAAENLSGGRRMRLRDVGERGFIEHLRQFAGLEGLGLLDDCALLQPMGPGMLVSTDTMVAGVHFDRSFMSWKDIGFRAVAGALSDLAASGASGRARYTVAIGLSGDVALEDALDIYRGMEACARACDAQLAGGDTVSSPTTFITVSVFAPTERALLRSGARAGDRVYCSGTLGASARGLELLRLGEEGPERERFLRPLPRMDLGRLLSALGATACVDVSDGLYPEIKAIADASGVGIEVEEEALPLVGQIPRSLALRYAYGGGEDYELVFTGPDDLLERIKEQPGQIPPCTAIGRVRDRGTGLVARRGQTLEALTASGYSHFSEGGG